MTYDKKQHAKEMSALRKYAVLQQAFEDRISVQKVYVDMTGDHLAAMVLDEIIFFTLPRENGNSGLRVWKDGFLWLASTRDEWWKRKRLTPRQVDGAIAKLLNKNLVFKEVHRFNGHGTTHLRLNIAEFFRQYGEAVAKVVNGEGEKLPVSVEEIETLFRMVSDLDESSTNPEQPVQNNEMVTSKSPNGETNNNLHLHPTQYIAATPQETLEPEPEAKVNGKKEKGVPPAVFGIEWHLAQDKPVDPAVLAADLQRQMLDAANLIATGQKNVELVIALVMAFQTARGMVIPEPKYNLTRKVVKNLIAANVQPAHVTQAVGHLLSQEKTRNSVTGMQSIENLAIGYATPVPTNQAGSQSKAFAL